MSDTTRNWTDRDPCPDRGHRFDDHCNWRSQDERDAHRDVMAAFHAAVESCTHKAYGSECEMDASTALDALYEHGWKVVRG